MHIIDIVITITYYYIYN